MNFDYGIIVTLDGQKVAKSAFAHPHDASVPHVKIQNTTLDAVTNIVHDFLFTALLFAH
jgi:hypothetical protein